MQITLEAAVEWFAELCADLGTTTRALDARNFHGPNQPKSELRAKLLCAPVKAWLDLTDQEVKEVRAGSKCVTVRVGIEWGGHTHHLEEPIVGARLSVSIADSRVGNPTWTYYKCGHYDARDIAWDGRDDMFRTTYVDSLDSLSGAILATIIAGGPLRPPTLAQQAQALDSGMPTDNPDEVTTENTRTRTPEGKWITRLMATGISHFGGSFTPSDFVACITEHGGTVIYDELSPAEGYVGTFSGGALREVAYEIAGTKRYGYVLTSVNCDDWSQEVWVTDHRLTAHAAATTIEDARKMVR